MQSVDQAVVHFNENQVLLLNICLAFLMFGVALDLKMSEFSQVSRNLKSILTGLFSQWFVLPALTVGLILIIKPHFSIAMGMLLVAASPGGNVSNYAVHLSGSNTWLSVILTTFSTLFCALSTPVIFGGLSEWLYSNEALNGNFNVSISNMVEAIAQLLLIPLALGMLMSHYRPEFTHSIKNGVRRISMLIFIAFVFAGIYTNLSNIGEYLHLVFIIVMIHNGLALLAGYYTGRIAGLEIADCRTISIETGIQNSGLALVLIFNFFDGLGGMALIAAWWSIWHLISAMLLALYWKSKKIEIALK